MGVKWLRISEPWIDVRITWKGKVKSRVDDESCFGDPDFDLAHITVLENFDGLPVTFLSANRKVNLGELVLVIHLLFRKFCDSTK